MYSIVFIQDCVYIYISICIYIYVYKDIHMYIYIYICMYVYIHIHTYIHRYLYRHIHVLQTHVCTHQSHHGCMSPDSATSRPRLGPPRHSGGVVRLCKMEGVWKASRTDDQPRQGGFTPPRPWLGGRHMSKQNIKQNTLWGSFWYVVASVSVISVSVFTKRVEPQHPQPKWRQIVSGWAASWHERNYWDDSFDARTAQLGNSVNWVNLFVTCNSMVTESPVENELMEVSWVIGYPQFSSTKIAEIFHHKSSSSGAGYAGYAMAMEIPSHRSHTDRRNPENPDSFGLLLSRKAGSPYRHTVGASEDFLEQRMCLEKHSNHQELQTIQIYSYVWMVAKSIEITKRMVETKLKPCYKIMGCFKSSYQLVNDFAVIHSMFGSIWSHVFQDYRLSYWVSWPFFLFSFFRGGFRCPQHPTLFDFKRVVTPRAPWCR